MRFNPLAIAILYVCFVLPSHVLAQEKQETEAEKLRREVEALMRRIDKLEASHCGPPDIKIGEHCQRNVKSPAEGKMKVTFYGQIDKAVAYFDNGNRNSIQEVDSDLSSTRIGANIEGNLSPDWLVGGEWLSEALDNSTRTAVIRGNATTQTAQPLITRKFEVTTTYKPWRTQLQLGRGYMASYYTVNFADMISSTYIATDGGKGIGEIATAIQFFDQTENAISNNTTGSTTAITIGNVFDDGDGLNRRNRVRLNIGPWAGFTVSTSHEFSVSDSADVALRYACEIHKVLIAAAIAYCEKHENTITLPSGELPNSEFHQVNGSIGFLLPIGLHFMFAGAKREWKWPGAKDGHYSYEKIAYEVWLTEAGKTALAIYAMQTENMFFLITQPSTAGTAPVRGSLLQLNNKGDAYGAALVQHLDRVATDLYAVWTNYRYRQQGPGAHKFDRCNVGLLGARVKF